MNQSIMKQRRRNTRPFINSISYVLIACLLGGCSTAPLARTRDDLVHNLGQKVAVEGTYEVGENGEHVRAADIDVFLDVSQDILGFGHSPISTGSIVRASGTVERGAMSLGVFQDEETLSRTRGRAEHPLLPGFVLRDAKVDLLKPLAAKPGR